MKLAVWEPANGVYAQTADRWLRQGRRGARSSALLAVTCAKRFPKLAERQDG